MLIQRDNIEVNMRDLAIESVFQPNATLQDRQAQSSIASDNDLDAIQTWLAVKCSNSTHTQSAYAKEARRFLVFMAYELGLTGLSDVKVEHLEAYWQHLARPPAHWLIGSPPSLSAPLDTRLLRGALSTRSIAYSRTVINSLYNYLKNANYLQQNPVAVSRKMTVQHSHAEKGLEPDAWRFFWQWLIQQQHAQLTPEKQLLAVRNRWMCALLYHSGLRRSSIASANMNQFYRRQGQWMLSVTIKGNRQHHVVVGEFLLQELQRYRLALGMSALPSPNDDRPLLINLRHENQKMSERNIGYLFEKMTAACAQDCVDPYLADQIRRLTCHGVRHTFATHSLIAGARLESVQHALGHQSISTTSIYARVSLSMQKELVDVLDQHWQAQFLRRSP